MFEITFFKDITPYKSDEVHLPPIASYIEAKEILYDVLDNSNQWDYGHIKMGQVSPGRVIYRLAKHGKLVVKECIDTKD